jgi:uncharacterized protein (DUF433 family)
MPVYACYRGDCSNLALDEPDCIVLPDALGREWLCVRTEPAEIPDDLDSRLSPLLRAQALAHKLGLSAEGSNLTLLSAPDDEGLARELVRLTCPRAEDSRRRLAEAGWLKQWEETQEIGAGRPQRVQVSNGKRTVEAEGETLAEAWHRAAEKALQEDARMTLSLEPVAVPLRPDDRGGYRVGASRVTLDTVIAEYRNGADPEGIARAYDTLALPDVYAVLAYYLRHKEEVDAHLARRRAEADRLRDEIEAEHGDRTGWYEELLARRERLRQEAERGQEHASSAER